MKIKKQRKKFGRKLKNNGKNLDVYISHFKLQNFLEVTKILNWIQLRDLKYTYPDAKGDKILWNVDKILPGSHEFCEE